jgi:hypothetical protein
MSRSKLSFALLALLSLPAFAEDPAPAPKPAEGAPATPPTNGAATTATPKGQGVKKQKPGASAEQGTDQKKEEPPKK